MRDNMGNNAGLVNWDFRHDFDRLLEGWFHPLDQSARVEKQFIPACEVEESDRNYHVFLEIAGVKKEDLKVEFDNNKMIISGERKPESRVSGEGSSYSERRFGKFQRSFTLPDGINSEKVEAVYQDGILKVTLPKADAAKPRQIQIFDGKSIRKEENHSVADSKSDQLAS